MSGEKEEQEYLIPFKDISIKCCKCYVDYWKSLRKQIKECSGSIIKFDYSIEKVKSYRKFFHEDKTLFHFCNNCFGCMMMAVPISLVEFEIRFRHRRGCVASILLGNQSLENICDSCINFVIERFSNDDFKIVKSIFLF